MTARGGTVLICAAAAALLAAAAVAAPGKPPAPSKQRDEGGSTQLHGDEGSRKPPDDLRVVSAGEIAVTIAWGSDERRHGEDGGDGGQRGRGAGRHGIVAYGVYRDGHLVATTTATSYSFSPLACGRGFVFGVDAVDKSGDRSAVSAVPGATTACTPPTAPGALTVTGATVDSVTVSWTASQDDTGVAGYELFLDGTSAGGTAGTSATFGGLSCGKSYVLEVDAVDVAGNRSAPSSVTAATAACPADRFVSPTGDDDRWTFVAATYDGAAVDVYVDGVLVHTTPASGPIAASPGAVRIGGNDIWGEWFAGRIDNARVYNRALDASALAADMGAAVTAAAPAPDPTGLVAAYSLDAGTGTTVADLSGHGNDGAIEGATWTADGRFGGALSFDGVDDRVTIPDSASLDLTTGMTLEAWVHPTALDGLWRTAIIKEQPPDKLAYALYARTDTNDPSGHVYTNQEFQSRAGKPLPRNDCTRPDDPCGTFDHAYAVATPGQVVAVSAGVYGDQRINADPAKAAGPDVLFRPAPGASVTVGQVTVAGASHVELRDMSLAGWHTLAGTDSVTFRNITAGIIFVDSSSNISIIGGSYGPQQNYDDGQIRPACGGCAHSTNILVDGAYFHDAVLTPGSDAHVECLQVWGTDHLVIRNSRFFNCEVHDVFISGESEPVSDITFENNWAGGVRSGFYSLRIAASGPGEGCKNILYRYNSTTVPISVQCLTVDNVRLVGNLGPLPANQCDPRYTFSHNVWDGTVCGPTDLNAPSGFVNPLVAPSDYVAAGIFDLDLLPTSAAIDAGDPADFPATDIYGHRRPRGLAPDAGAVEAR